MQVAAGAVVPVGEQLGCGLDDAGGVALDLLVLIRKLLAPVFSFLQFTQTRKTTRKAGTSQRKSKTRTQARVAVES